MLKTICSLSVLVALSLALTGCNDKGRDFIGHWKEIDAQHPFELDIKYDDGLFHVDLTEYSIPSADFYKTKFESKAESNNVLSSHGDRQMRLSNGVLDYDGREYSKSS